MCDGRRVVDDSVGDETSELNETNLVLHLYYTEVKAMLKPSRALIDKMDGVGKQI